jgi:hypothetical protein
MIVDNRRISVKAPDITSPLYDGIRLAMRQISRGARAYDEARSLVIDTLNAEQAGTLYQGDFCFRVEWNGECFLYATLRINGQYQYFDTNGNLLEEEPE